MASLDSSEGIICPNCGRLHQNVSGKCPNPKCRPTRAVQPLELRGLSMVTTKRRCSHGILLHWPCSKCDRSDAADLETYKRSFLCVIKELLIRGGVNKSEAWERSKKLLAAIDSWETQKAAVNR